MRGAEGPARTSGSIALAIAALLLLPLLAGDFWAYQMGLLYLYAIAARSEEAHV